MRNTNRRYLEMYQFLKRHKYLFPIVGIILFIISPIYIPLMMCIEYKQDIKDFYHQCYLAVFDWSKL